MAVIATAAGFELDWAETAGVPSNRRAEIASNRGGAIAVLTPFMNANP
ncbi:MAG: hypothetical protein L0Z53_13490 [Acidobacteriales bacterium]|nr:hypothetical protein [Terriglobales bacterium]